MRTLTLVLPFAPILAALLVLAALGLGLTLEELRRCRRDGRSLLTGRARA